MLPVPVRQIRMDARLGRASHRSERRDRGGPGI